MHGTSRQRYGTQKMKILLSLKKHVHIYIHQAGSTLVEEGRTSTIEDPSQTFVLAIYSSFRDF